MREFADEAGLPPVDEQVLGRFARRIAMGVAHSMLATIDNGAALAERHLLSLVEIDASGTPLPGGELSGGLYERVFDYLPDDYLAE